MKYRTAFVSIDQTKSRGRLYRTMAEVEALASGVKGILLTAPNSDPGARDSWTLTHEPTGAGLLRGFRTSDVVEARRVARALGRRCRWDSRDITEIRNKVRWSDVLALISNTKWGAGPSGRLMEVAG